jgi:acetaldehyde dehydrogenase/alcohol dehydrogenase
LNISLTIKDTGVSEKNFYTNLDKISKLALDDQCTGSNSRFPLTSEIKQTIINAFD